MSFPKRLVVTALIFSMPLGFLAPAEATTQTVCSTAGTTFPDSLSAGFGGGTGIAEDPWLICSTAQLAGISTNATTRDGAYKLQANLNLGGSNSPWTPIGPTFTGFFDGARFSISNIYVTSGANTAKFGLFQSVSGSGTVVKDLVLSGEFVSTFGGTDNFNNTQRAGVVSGDLLSSAVIENIRVTSVRFNGLIYYAGGAVGYVQDSTVRSVIVDGFEMTIPYRNSRSRLGGVVGYALSSILFRVAAAGEFRDSLSADRYNLFAAGGLVGDLTGGSVLSQGYSRVDWNNSGPQPLEAFSDINIGALAGTVDAATVRDSAAIATATSIRYYSGLVGKFDRTTVTTQRLLSVVTPSVLTDAFPVVRRNPNNQNASASFFNLQTWGDATILENTIISGVTAKTTSALKQKATYDAASWSIGLAGSAEVTSGWSLSDQSAKVWKIADGQYPTLVWLDFYPATVVFKSNFSGGPADVSQIVDATNGSSLVANSFVRNGHVFDSWNTEPDGSGLEFEDEESSITKPLTLYAQWKAVDTAPFFDVWQSPISDNFAGPVPGETIWASAFERTLSRQLYKPSIQADIQYPTPEEYVYRITKQENSLSSVVDPQSASGYSILTAQQQSDWYENDLYYDPDTNPYLFSWVAFLCLNNANQSLSNPVNLSFSYATREDALLQSGGIDSVANSFYREVLNSLYTNTNPSTRTVVGSQVYNTFYGTQTNMDTVLAVSTVNGTCQAGTQLEAFPLVDVNSSAGNPSYIQSKSFAIPEQIVVWNRFVGANGEPKTLEATGVTIGVTGRAVSFNAALWGLTRIAAPISSSPSVPSRPYEGPLKLKFEGNQFCTGDSVVVRGERLITIESVMVGARSVPFEILSNGNLQFSLRDVTPGRYTVKLGVPISSVNLTEEIVISDCKSGSITASSKVNVGSFNGKLVVYASDLEGRRISWKVGGKWGRQVANSSFARFDRPTPRKGVTVNVRIFIDGVPAFTRSVLTR